MLSKISHRVARLQARKCMVQASAKGFADQSTTDIRATTGEDYGITSRDSFLQFSKAPILSNFGELPFGEIPEPLKYVRPFEMTTLSNGIRVCTESWNTGLASVNVFVGSGSRQEAGLDASGAANLTRRMLKQGTSKRTRDELATDLSNLGGGFNSWTCRESTGLTLQVLAGQAGNAVELLGDMVSNSQFNDAQVEVEKEALSSDHESSFNNRLNVTLENAHFNAYREHMMGQPREGDRDNVGNLTGDAIRDYYSGNFFGDNIVVVATGNVSHNEIVDQVEQHFSSIQKNSSQSRNNSEKSVFSPAVLNIRDDEMVNSNVGVFYDAPGWGDEDFYAFQLLKHVFGDFSIDRNAGHLNDVQKQYNALHSMLGDLPDVTMAKSFYLPYSDCGLFGNYFFGNEVFTRQMNYVGMAMPTVYGHYFTDVEVFRARNSLYNELLQQESSNDVAREIGTQVLNTGRRVPRSEVAKRVAHIDNYHMRHLCYNWFYDAEPSITNWGPIEAVSQVGSYKYFKIHTMSTVSNAHHALYC